ncbi:MAG: sulfatase [Fibrobacterota bacterium]
MKAIMVMFDSLNRHMLSPYGCDRVKTPNFDRLASKSVTFTNSYAGSMPCMPARRELHTGRYNFLHRSWGPIEPFDDSMPEILKNSGVYSHLVSDHYHYWEDGGSTYHERYSSWELSRGQEGDPWKGEVGDPEIPSTVNKGYHKRKLWRQDWVNRKYMDTEEKMSQAKTFKKGLEFLETNKDEDNWFLQIETFDPHEPFFSQESYKKLYPHHYEGKHFDWPEAGKVDNTPEETEHVKMEYAALMTMCDNYLGKVLDFMDRHEMWKDTMLIVNTDHGFLLGEHDFWAKCRMPFYQEIIHTPFFVWDPRFGKKGEKRGSLVQTIDIAPTILDFFNIDIPKDMQGKPLGETVNSDKPVREAALFGMHGGHVNCTDGKYVYMRGPVKDENRPLFEYTLMPTHMNCRFSVDEMKTARLAGPFEFTKECKTLRTRGRDTDYNWYYGFETKLFDVEKDPEQKEPLNEPETEKRMIGLMKSLMRENDAPDEQYERLGI